MSRHSFQPEIAKQVGVNAAVIYQSILFWTEKALANEKHIHDGKVYAYNSVKAWGELFPYLTANQIRTALEKLVEAGLIFEGNFNETAYDRTKWYGVPTQIHLGKITNGFGKNHEPIPVSNPDREPYDEETVVSSSAHRALTVQPETTAVAPSQPSQSKKGTRLPENWVLPRAWGEWALAEGWAAPVIRAEAEKFRDFWISTTGRNAAKLDWFATWRNWMRNSKAPRGQQGGQHGRQDALANWVDAFVNGAD